MGTRESKMVMQSWRAVMAVAISCSLIVCAAARAERLRASYSEAAANTVSGYVEKALPDLFAFYKDLHAHPELSLHEERSSGLIAKRFQQAGYDVTERVGGYGVVGVLRNGDGPTVLIRGDMDALPVAEETGLPYASKVTATRADGSSVGVMHACGHDVHQTVLVGTATALAESREHWKGTVLAIAQPAEEVGMGARMMIEDGLFERFPRPDYCIALHVSGDLPTGQIGYTSGWALANVDSVDITIYGKGGHGSRPNLTVDPVVTAAYVVTALQTVVSRRVDPIEPAVITVGSIHSGSKHNIISDRAQMQITVRSYTDETRGTLLDGIRDVTVNTCRAMGCTRDPDVVVSDEEYTPACYNNPELVASAIQVLGRVVGGQNVLEVPARMGGEDFGRYARHLEVPGFMFWLGSVERRRYEASRKEGGEPLPPIHSGGFAPDPEPTIETGIKSLATLALSLLESGNSRAGATSRE